jgi:hypothetical protein
MYEGEAIVTRSPEFPNAILNQLYDISNVPQKEKVNLRKESRCRFGVIHQLESSFRLILEASPIAGVGVPPIELSSRSKMPHVSVVNLTTSSCLKQGIAPIKVAGGLNMTRRTY